MRLVELAGGRCAQKALMPAAFILSRAGALDLDDGVSFGCNYDLDVLSFELQRGYVRAIDCGLLKGSFDEVWLGGVGVPAAQERPSTATLDHANFVFGLTQQALETLARLLLLTV